MAGTIVICFTDIVASTEFTTRVGDEAFDEIRRRHFAVLERQIETNGGEVVKGLGDGLMVTFGSASDAVAAAVAMQRAVEAASRGEGEPVTMRVGISAGDATRENDDWFGTPVVEGARLCAAAAPGQILASEVVRLLAGNRGGHDFRSLGALELKGLPDPIGTVEVGWTPAAATLAMPLPGPLTADEGELAFAGRDEALDQLRVEWKQAAAGERRVTMVAGEPGIGKTRLVAELARSVHSENALVLLGRADEHVDAPYAPWREALRALVRDAPDEILDAHAAEHGGALLRVVPDLARRVDGLEPTDVPDPETERLLLFEAVNALLSAVAVEAPVMLVLDDLHWADRSSLLLLLHVLRADTPAPIFVVATYRDTDIDRTHPLGAVLADLRRQRGASRLSLGGLDDDGIAALLERQGGHDLDAAGREFATTLWRETEGNPFFIREVLFHLIETGGLVQEAGRWRAASTLDRAGLPEGIREVVGRRLSDLPDETSEMLAVASIVGREFDVAFVATIADTSVDDTLARLEAAESARLIGEAPGRPGRYAFAHALVRTVLTEELGTNRRVRLHRAAGLALEAQPDPPLDQLAYHFGEAAVMGETERAVRYASAAAEQALALAAGDDAVALARRALETADLGDVSDETRMQVLLLLGRTLYATGEYGAGNDVVGEVFEHAMARGDTDVALTAAMQYGAANAFARVGDERGPEQLRRLIDTLPAGDSIPRANALAALADWIVNAPGTTAADIAREAYEMAVRVGADDARLQAAGVRAQTARNIDPAAQLRFSRERQEQAAGFEDWGIVAMIAEAHLTVGDLEGAERVISDAGTELARSPLRDIPAYRANRQMMQDGFAVVRALIAGDLPGAEAAVDRLGDLAIEGLTSFNVLLGRVQIAYVRGQWELTAEIWAALQATAPALTAHYFGYVEPDLSQQALRERCARWRDAAEQHPAWSESSNVGMLAEAFRRIGDRDASAELVRTWSTHSGWCIGNSVMWLGGLYDTALGIASGTAGDLDGAVAYHEHAVTVADAISSPTWGGVARLELALAARRNGDRAKATKASADAREMMTAVGMPGWLERLDRFDAGDDEPWRLPGDG